MAVSSIMKIQQSLRSIKIDSSLKIARIAADDLQEKKQDFPSDIKLSSKHVHGSR